MLPASSRGSPSHASCEYTECVWMIPRRSSHPRVSERDDCSTVPGVQPGGSSEPVESSLPHDAASAQANPAHASRAKVWLKLRTMGGSIAFRAYIDPTVSTEPVCCVPTPPIRGLPCTALFPFLWLCVLFSSPRSALARPTTTRLPQGPAPRPGAAGAGQALGREEARAGSGGSSASGGSGGGAAGVSGSGGAATGGSGGSNVGGSSGTGGSGGDPNYYKGGYVSVMQSIVEVSGTEYASYSFAAGFSRGEIDTSGSACDIHDDGPCKVTDCTSQGTSTPSYETVGAGTIQLLGANIPLSISPDASGTYAVVTGQQRLWSGGATLTLSAAGGEAPAFEETLFGASPVTLTSPALPAPGTPVTLSTSGPLTVSWSGGIGGKVTAMLTRTISSSTTRSVMLTCSFAATDGSGTVPASAMAAIPPGPDGTFQVLGGDMKTIEPDGWTITLQEYVPAVTSDGNAASVMATYQ